MAYGDDNNDQTVFCNLAEYAVVAHSVAPNALFIAMENFASCAGIDKDRDFVFKIVKDCALPAPINFVKLAFGGIEKFNVPSFRWA